MYPPVAPGSTAQPSVTLLAGPLVLDPSSLGANGGPAGPPRGAARGLAQPGRRAGTRRQTTAATCTWGYFQVQKGPSSGHVPRLGGARGCHALCDSALRSVVGAVGGPVGALRLYIWLLLYLLPMNFPLVKAAGWGHDGEASGRLDHNPAAAIGT